MTTNSLHHRLHHCSQRRKVAICHLVGPHDHPASHSPTYQTVLELGLLPVSLPLVARFYGTLAHTCHHQILQQLLLVPPPLLVPPLLLE